MPSERTLLFVDDHDILYRPATKRVLHPLTRHPANPVLPDRERPWEIAIGWCSVSRQSHNGRYQLWYQCYTRTRGSGEDKSRRCVVCYADSDDGIHWRKPNLGLYDFYGHNETNIVILANGGYSDRYGASVVVDANDPDPARRYKMAHYDFCIDEEGIERPGLTVAFSPDGIRWTKYPQGPLLRTSYGQRGSPVPLVGEEETRQWDIPLSMSDGLDVMYDPQRDAFAIYGKMWIDGPDGRMYWKHGMGRTESKDFIHWTRPQLILTPDEFDPDWVEFHHAPVFYYNGCYFALLQILDRGERGGVMDIELAISRDGLRWERPFRQPYFLAKSEGTAFDSGSLLTNSTPVFLADEFRFYYGAYGGGATGDHDYVFKTGVGLATMPRDRFAGVRPIHEQGQITLRPVDLSDCQRITLNANARGGSIYVELLDANGRRVPGFLHDDAIPLTDDGLRQPVRWKERQPSELPPGLYMPRLFLRNAEVFAITLHYA